VPSLVSLSSTPRGYGFLLFSLTDLSTHLSISPPCRLSPATRSLAVTVRRTYSSPNLPTPRPPGEPPCVPTQPHPPLLFCRPSPLAKPQLIMCGCTPCRARASHTPHCSRRVPICDGTVKLKL
jgi:hypothetical protein